MMCLRSLLFVTLAMAVVVQGRAINSTVTGILTLPPESYSISIPYPPHQPWSTKDTIDIIFKVMETAALALAIHAAVVNRTLEMGARELRETTNTILAHVARHGLVNGQGHDHANDIEKNTLGANDIDPSKRDHKDNDGDADDEAPQNATIGGV